MAVSSVTITAPAPSQDMPDTIVRPAVSFKWAGGTGPFDYEVTWDDDSSFNDGNGNRQIRTAASATSPVTIGPSADLADLTVQWYIRVRVIDTADLQNEIQTIAHDHTGGTHTLSFDGQGPTGAIDWDDDGTQVNTELELLSNITAVTVTGIAGDLDVEFTDPGDSDLPLMTIDDANLTGGTVATVTEDTAGDDGVFEVTDDFTYFLTNPLDRVHLHANENVGVAFDPTDEPAGGWGTGGTVGADGDVIEFRRYLHANANAGIGFEKDKPAAGWGPNSPASDHPDGDNIEFRRYLHANQNVDTTQPCPFLFSLSRTVVETGDSITVSGQGLVSADDPTDAWDAEVRLYEAADFGAAFVTLATVTWDAGETLDTITATVPAGAASGFIAVVHTTTPSCSGSNFLGLTVIALPADRQAGWWVEAWNIRNTAPVVRPIIDAVEATIETVANDIGRGTLSLPANHPDLLDIVDRTASPPNQTVVKVYQHGRFSYAFVPEDYTSTWDEDGAHLVRLYGDGQETMLTWGRCLWKDFPAQPAVTRTWLYGSTANAADWGTFEPDSVLGNGGFEDANHDPWVGVATGSITAQTDEARTGAYGGRVITAALNDGAEIDVSVEEAQQGFFDIWVSNVAGGSKTFVLQVVDEDDTVQATDTVVVSTAAWQPLSTSWVPGSGQTVRMRIIQTVGAVGTFWIDDAAAFTHIGTTFDTTGATYQLTRDHTTGGLHSLEVSAEAGGSTSFKGIVGFFSVAPGQQYSLSMQLSGTTASVVRVALRLGGTVDAVEHVLTGPDGVFDVVTVTGLAGPEETTARFAISSKDAAALVFYVDDLTALPGAAEASGGQIVLDVLAAIQARGTLDWVVTDFTGATDSSGMPWPETLRLEVNPEWTLYDLIEYLVGLGYDYEYTPVNWRAGGDTGWQLRLFGPLGAGVPWQLETDGPVILPGPSLANARPSAAPPVSTVVYGEGAGGVWTVAQLSAATLTALERREDFVSNTAVGDTVTLFKVLSHRLDVAETRGRAYTADITNAGDPLPWFDFVTHDRLRSHLPTAAGQADHVPDDTYRVAAMTAKLTAGGRYQEYAVDFGNYRLHAQRLRDLLQKRLLQRAATENYQPGTGRVGASGAGGTSTAGGAAPADTVGGLVAPHEHAWPDVLPPNVGGDLAGAMPNPTVARIRATPVETAAPTDGQYLRYSSAASQYETASQKGGEATIANAASSEVVPHGLGSAPNYVVVTPQADDRVWVSAIDATNITVTRAGTTGALDFYWHAEL